MRSLELTVNWLGIKVADSVHEPRCAFVLVPKERERLGKFKRVGQVILLNYSAPREIKRCEHPASARGLLRRRLVLFRHLLRIVVAVRGRNLTVNQHFNCIFTGLSIEDGKEGRAKGIYINNCTELTGAFKMIGAGYLRGRCMPTGPLDRPSIL